MPPGSNARLDVLLYAHDGRGHGHVSRAIAIGLALRRIAPELRVLLVTGAANVAELEEVGELDWVKLPSRRAVVETGRVAAEKAASNLEGEALTSVRGTMLAAIVADLSPRCVLVDHLPLGKDAELAPALAAAATGDGAWILGLRAVLGEVAGHRDGEAIRAARKSYRDVLWYGDRRLHGCGALDAVVERFGREAIPCGLVSRASELALRLPALRDGRKDRLGTISVSWCGPDSASELDALARALRAWPDPRLEWHAYIGPPRGSVDRTDLMRQLDAVPGCTAHDFGPGYLRSLRRSRIAITYAGYNSIVDTLWAGVPAILLTHPTSELEQDAQAELMTRACSQYALLPNGEATESRWTELISDRLRCDAGLEPPLDGAERAARHLLERIAG